MTAARNVTKVVYEGDAKDYEESFDVDYTDDGPYARWNIIEPLANWTESKVREYLLANPKNAPALKAIVAIQEPCDGKGHDFIFIEVEHPTTFQLIRTRVAYSIILRVPAYSDVVRKYHSMFKQDRRKLEFPIPVDSQLADDAPAPSSASSADSETLAIANLQAGDTEEGRATRAEVRAARRDLAPGGDDVFPYRGEEFDALVSSNALTQVRALVALSRTQTHADSGLCALPARRRKCPIWNEHDSSDFSSCARSSWTSTTGAR
mmetsp:Transcript_36899/g.97604  ORF Transcript_36899/g.97604 Transcript_36899/m.97604 type:complete len:264 (+) Transcript_36899:427-1218(+)